MTPCGDVRADGKAVQVPARADKWERGDALGEITLLPKPALPQVLLLHCMVSASLCPSSCLISRARKSRCSGLAGEGL